MFYYTGDLHGNIHRVLKWLETDVPEGEKWNYLSVLGDAGMNYYLDVRDDTQKYCIQRRIDELKEKRKNVQILFVRGNHECRPERIITYSVKKLFGGEVYIQEEYPDLIFLKDGEVYEIEDKKFMILGGGYSSDFLRRILQGEGFWFDEQLSEQEFLQILNAISGWKEDVYILSHMMPFSILHKKSEWFTRETRMEHWLQAIKEKLDKNIIKWLSGHYHCEWQSSDGRFEIIYEKIRELK